MTRYFIGTSEDDIYPDAERYFYLKDAQKDLTEQLEELTSDDMKNNPELTPRIFKVEVTEVA